MQDNIFDIFEVDMKKFDFYETFKREDYHERVEKNTEVAEREYISIFLRADSEKRMYTRVSYDILTYLGDLGGLLDLVLVVGSLCSSFFTRRLFTAALIRQAYRI